MYESFYLKVQTKLLSQLLNESLTSLVVTDWDSKNFFVSQGAVFYIIPKKSFFLTDRFYQVPSEVFKKEVQFAGEIWDLSFSKISRTGEQCALTPWNPFDSNVVIRFSNGLFIAEKNLELFQKQLVFCESPTKPSPVFVLSPLLHLLGGVNPVSGISETD